MQQGISVCRPAGDQLPLRIEMIVDHALADGLDPPPFGFSFHREQDRLVQPPDVRRQMI
jgi:hypothetical protein